MVKGLSPAFGGGNGYLEVFLDPVLPDEIAKLAGAEAGIKGEVLFTGFTRNDASDLTLPPYEERRRVLCAPSGYLG